MEKVGEGVSTQKDARVDTLRSKFHRFKHRDGETVMSTYNRLCKLAGELKSLGATDVTDIMVVRTLLRSLDDSFAHLVMMIRERPDFRNLKPVDIIERLKTHEMEEEERREVNGSSKKSHALKAKVSHDSLWKLVLHLAMNLMILRVLEEI